MPSNNTSAPELIAQGIGKHFGDVEALRDVNVTVIPGKITAFVGPNGAGKTTLFHIMNGNLRPDSGKILLDGKDITGLPPWRIARMHVGKLFQDVRIFENLTVLENVCVALLYEAEHHIVSSLLPARYCNPCHKYREEALHWLKYVGLENEANQMGGELSFGQQKLLAIARLIAHKSTFLLLDEPTAALSPIMIPKMVDLVRKLSAEHPISIALIEHNMKVVKELAFYTYFMHEGSIYCHGDHHSVLENPEVRELYMGLKR